MYMCTCTVYLPMYMSLYIIVHNCTCTCTVYLSMYMSLYIVVHNCTCTCVHVQYTYTFVSTCACMYTSLYIIVHEHYTVYLSTCTIYLFMYMYLYLSIYPSISLTSYLVYTCCSCTFLSTYIGII